MFKIVDEIESRGHVRSELKRINEEIEDFEDNFEEDRDYEYLDSLLALREHYNKILTALEKID